MALSYKTTSLSLELDNTSSIDQLDMPMYDELSKSFNKLYKT